MRFHGLRHPVEMGAAEVTAFLTHLAAERGVSASTQNQAASALLFLYRQVLGYDIERLETVVRAKRPRPRPVVLTRREVATLLSHLSGDVHRVALLLYGGGLRLLEALRLRVKDVDLERREIAVRREKGERDRVTVLPGAAVAPLRQRSLTGDCCWREQLISGRQAPRGCLADRPLGTMIRSRIA